MKAVILGRNNSKTAERGLFLLESQWVLKDAKCVCLLYSEAGRLHKVCTNFPLFIAFCIQSGLLLLQLYRSCDFSLWFYTQRPGLKPLNLLYLSDPVFRNLHLKKTLCSVVRMGMIGSYLEYLNRSCDSL